MNVKPSNPFIINSQYVSDEYFCDRCKETRELCDNLKNGRNTVLISPRRMGKTGLIRHCFVQKEIETPFIPLFVDIFSTSNAREFTCLFGKEVFRVLKSSQKRFSDKFFQYVRSLVGSASLDPVTGAPKLNLQLGQIKEPEVTLEEIFNYLESSPKPCIVAIDEFQQLAEYPEKNMVAVLRTFVQQCKQTRFIFSGSKKRVMTHLFNSPSEPFYMSCRSMSLEPIDRDVYYDFARSHFNAAKKDLNRECFDAVYDQYEGHTWFIQHLMNQLFQDTSKGKTAGKEMLREATQKIIWSYEKSYEEFFKHYSERQRELLIAVAKEGRAHEILSEEFVKNHSLPSVSSVQSAARALLEDDTLTNENGEYYITNRFFSLWLAERF